MSFIFISHAREDKLPFIRPLVEVLVEEGEPVWIDRPGAGQNNFQFDNAYIQKNVIDYLNSGEHWSQSVRSAIRHCGAVLGCISKHMDKNREAIHGELLLAQGMQKLALCIVDESDLSSLSQISKGLLDIDHAQAPRLNIRLLRAALKEKFERKCAVSELTKEHRQEWEKVRNLIASIDRLRTTPRTLRSSDLPRLTRLLSNVPIGPILRVSSIPTDLLEALGDHIDEVERVRNVVSEANRLVVNATEGKGLAQKLEIRLAKLPPIGGIGADAFWEQLFAYSGLISRRTVAAILLSPTSAWAFNQKNLQMQVQNFIAELVNETVN